MQGQRKFSLSEEQISSIIEAMKANAEVVPQIELTPENWLAEFGTEGIVSTPIGEVKMGDGQYQKLIDQNREQYFGCIKLTLTNPDAILEEYDAKEGAERDTKMLFVKTFIKSDGGRYVHFASVTVRKENLEVSISSHEVKEKKVKEKMHNNNVVHLNETLLDSEWRLTKPQNKGSDLVPTPSVISKSKDTTFIPENQTNVGKFSLISPEMDASYLDAVERLMNEMLTTKSDFGKDNLKYVNKEIAMQWLGIAPPEGAASLTDAQQSIAKIIKDFPNPKIEA